MDYCYVVILCNYFFAANPPMHPVFFIFYILRMAAVTHLLLVLASVKSEKKNISNDNKEIKLLFVVLKVIF